MRRFALLGVVVGSLALAAACTPVPPPPPEPEVLEVPFGFTNGAQTWEVPAGVDEITVEALGASGGHGYGRAEDTAVVESTGGIGGLGAQTLAVIPVSPAETLEIHVGGRGGDGAAMLIAQGGFNGGASGEVGGCTDPDPAVDVSSGAGGGASDVRQGGTGLEHRVVVAGGGGGGGSPYAYAGGFFFPGGGQAVVDGGGGGDGGGVTGSTGGGATPGGGGTQTAGGIAGSAAATAGSQGQGGEGDLGVNCIAAARGGGGGGGGWFGGGGGGANPPAPGDFAGGGGGGGGSGFGPPVTEFETGVREGNGRVVIRYLAS